MKEYTDYSKNVKSLNAVIEYRKKLNAALKIFNKRKFKKKIIKCPFCETTKSKEYFKIDIVSYKICNNCKSIYVSPRPNQKIINEFYEYINKKKIYINSLPKKFSNNRVKHVIRPQWNQFVHEIKKIKKTNFDNYLEIGAGIGYFTKISLEKKISKNYLIIEPDIYAANQLKKISKKIKIFPDKLENFNLENNKKKFNIVFINNVIEHPQNINIFFYKLRQIVAKNCVIVLHDMSAEGLDVKLLQNQTPNYNAYNILQIGSLMGIKNILKRSGFQLIKTISTGEMDTDIIYENLIVNSSTDDNLNMRLLEIFRDKIFRKNFQEFLKKHFLTGYNTYFFKPF